MFSYLLTEEMELSASLFLWLLQVNNKTLTFIFIHRLTGTPHIKQANKQIR